jgi:hypothetical protein
MGDAMNYALIVNNAIEAVQGRLPRGADADGQWIEPVTEANAASCGWFPVVDVSRPDDTDTHTHDRSVELVNGTPTVVWTERPWTAEELTARTQAANAATLSDRDTLDVKLAELRSFLTDPDVEFANNVANTTALTAQQQNRLNKALIRQARRDANFTIRLARYTFGLLDDITDI